MVQRWNVYGVMEAVMPEVRRSVIHYENGTLHHLAHNTLCRLH